MAKISSHSTRSDEDAGAHKPSEMSSSFDVGDPEPNSESALPDDMPDVLERICARMRIDVEQRSQITPLKEITARAREVDIPTRGFSHALKQMAANCQVGLIAEIKKASPSAGIIRQDYDPAAIAQTYQSAGATCLSVLTEPACFHGSTDDLEKVKAVSSLPILRKDFIVDPWQVHESRIVGADCILIILAALTDAEASELIALARGLDMDVLCEVHSEAELNRALSLDTVLIGINNRNLRTLKTDIKTTLDLAPLVPPDRIVISESGIKTHAEVMRIGQAGASGLLVGESLLHEEDPGLAARRLMGTL